MEDLIKFLQKQGYIPEEMEEFSFIEIRDEFLNFIDDKGGEVVMRKSRELAGYFKILVQTAAKKLVRDADYETVMDYCSMVGWKLNYLRPILEGDQVFFSQVTDIDPVQNTLNKETLSTLREIRDIMKKLAKLLEVQGNGKHASN